VKLLVTGANGFLGTAVVRRAVDAGHDTVALIRPAAELGDPIWDHASVRVVRGDLRQRGEWVEQLGDVDAVVHLAAAASGDLATQFHGTVIATENLLAWLDLTRVARFVHISSFSVYGYAALRQNETLDESCPLETAPQTRDAYTATKLLQEQLVREATAAAGTELVVLRPGAIYGPGKDWNFGAAMSLGSRAALVFAPRATFRLTYVDNCADAIVAACTAPNAAGETLNIVDDNLPSHLQYFKQCQSAGAEVPMAIPVPWALVSVIGRAVALVDTRLLAGRAKLPEFLAHVRQQARWRPLNYSNARAKQVLGWSPRVTLSEAVRHTVAKR
jgi:2-alkyl-3-oxoalkanoate reductase